MTDHRRARFERCFETNYRGVSAYLLRRCTTREDAEDAAAEVFAVAWRRLDDIPPPPEDRLWLFGVARRVVANQLRASRRRDRLRLRLEAERPAPAVDRVAVEASPVARALHALGDRDREVLLLIGWEELTVAEAARVLGVPAPLVSRRLYRARRRLAHRLDAARRRDLATAGHARTMTTTSLESTS